MLKSKSASWIAFSIGFSIASPQAAIAAAPKVDCKTTSHPSCLPAKRAKVSKVAPKVAKEDKQQAEARKLEEQLKIARLESQIATQQSDAQHAVVKQLEEDIANAQEVRNSHAELLHAKQAEIDAALAKHAQARELDQARRIELERETAEVDAKLAALSVAASEAQQPAVALPATESSREIIILKHEEQKTTVTRTAESTEVKSPSSAAPVAQPAVQIEVKQQRLKSGADLTAEEAAVAFRGLSAKTVDGKTVVFDALIFKSCIDVFNENVDTEQVTDGSRVGVRFRDPGQKFLGCMQSKQALTCNKGQEGDECVRLSEVDTYKEIIKLPAKITGPIEFGVFTAQKDRAEDAFDFTALSTYRAPSVIKAEKNKELREKAAAQRENYSCAVTECVRVGDLAEARKACKELGKLSFLGALDPATKKELAEEFAKCTGDIDEAILADLAASFQDEKDAKALLKKADQLVRIAKNNRKYANAIAEILLGKANALSNSTDGTALPTLAALNIPGVGTLGANNNPMIESMRSLKVTEDRLELARSLYKKGLMLGATKDWNALFNQKLTELDFTACGARAQALGITAPQVQACLNQNAAVAQTLVQENCQNDQYSSQCMNAAMLYQGVQSTYGTAVQKTQELAIQKQKQLLQTSGGQQSGVMGNGTGFLGLSGLNTGTNLPGGLTSINPSNGMPGLQNLGLRNPGMNTIGSTTSSLPNVSFQ